MINENKKKLAIKAGFYSHIKNHIDYWQNLLPESFLFGLYKINFSCIHIFDLNKNNVKEQIDVIVYCCDLNTDLELIGNLGRLYEAPVVAAFSCANDSQLLLSVLQNGADQCLFNPSCTSDIFGKELVLSYFRFNRSLKNTNQEEIFSVDNVYDSPLPGYHSALRGVLDDAVRESEKRFREIVSSMAGWIWETDIEWRFTYCSEKVCDFIGLSADELIGKSLFDRISSRQKDSVIKMLTSLANTQSPVNDYEIWHTHNLGHEVCLLVSGIPIIDHDERFVGYRGVNKDITRQKEAEETLRKSNERLKELDRLKSEFLSTVSHELRTPIAIMGEGVNLCLDGVAGELNETQADLLRDTSRSIDRLSRLIGDLLDVSRIEAGKLVLRRKMIDLNRIISSLAGMFEVSVNEKNIHLNILLTDAPLYIYADEDKIIQIINNLLSNALRFTPEKGVIEIKCREGFDEVHCSVSDTGIGIAKQDIPKLFSKFAQVGRVDGPGYKGTGLGLVIAKGLVEKHGGRVWIDSKKGRGTNVYFTIKKVSSPIIYLINQFKQEKSWIENLKEKGYKIEEFCSFGSMLSKLKSRKPHLLAFNIESFSENMQEWVVQLQHSDETSDIPVLVSIHTGSTFFNADLMELENISIISGRHSPEEIQNKICDLLIE